MLRGGNMRPQLDQRIRAPGGEGMSVVLGVEGDLNLSGW